MSATASADQPPPPRIMKGTLRLVQPVAQIVHLGGAGRGLDRLVAAGVGHVDAVGQHVFGQRQHDRARPAVDCAMERLADIFRDAGGVVDLGHPFGHRAVHAAEVDLLECLALHLVARHLADEQDHRRRILEGGVDADRGVGRAGAAGDKADAGAAGQLAVGLGHVGGAAFLPADDQLDLGRVVQGIERRQVAFARDAEGGVDAVDLQLVDEDLAAGAQIAGIRHGGSFAGTGSDIAERRSGGKEAGAVGMPGSSGKWTVDRSIA